jgi:ribosomal protein S17E|tara:strand:+ start:14308 stop:14478 length:171 start_codon:yes stop_codon:yes gene_type:complete
MALSSRQTYLNNVFNRMHEKLNDAYEDVFDGDFEQSKNTVNSLIYDLRQLKKSMNP